MDTQELRTLRLFEEIESEKAPSQRDLATRLNISLGLVNSFMKRLTQKGYFKITHIPKNRVKYILTPKGAAEKTRLTYEYIQYSFQFYKTARQKMRELFQALGEAGVKTIVFYGATDLAEIAYLSLQETSIQLVAVIDTRKMHNRFLGLEIQSPESLRRLSFDRILITEIESQKREIIDTILNVSVEENKISMLN